MSDACCGRDTCAPAAPPPAAREAARSPGERLRPYLPVLFGGVTLGVSLVAGQLGWRAPMVVAALATIAATIGGPARRAWRSIRARVLDINTLMVIAVAGAAALGDWVEAGAVVWLFAVAQHLEHASQQRARRAAHGLLTLAPDVAIVRRAAGEVEVPAASVRPGDIVVVRPGARFAVDGRVVAGESDVNQAPVTGESTPVEKGPGDEVFAGSVNGNAALEVEATRPASDSTLARIGRLVEQAQRQRAPIQGLVDRFARRYTPAVVLVALAIAIVPPLVTGGVSGFTETAGTWTYRALALLVVACPCALVISTPVSIVSGLTAAARAGVLVKGGAHLERLGRLRAVAFDKTGTLTHGDVAVTGVHGLDEAASPHGVLAVAAALESRSEHPIGRAIVSHAMRTGVPIEPGDGFRALPGFGAEGTVALSPAVVGSHRLFEERQLCTDALHARIGQVERGGSTAVLVGHGGAPLGVIGLADRVRAEGRAAVEALRAEGVAHVALLSGDVRASVNAVRDATGLDEAWAELLPAEKVAHVERLRHRWGSVAMVGDGINDAPALAAADVGIAMGAAGTDVAIETADVALMSDALDRLPFALRLGRRTLANIRQNVAIALGLKIAFVVLAAAGVATLWMAVLADTGASLLVTANGLRLLRLRA